MTVYRMFTTRLRNIEAHSFVNSVKGLVIGPVPQFLFYLGLHGGNSILMPSRARANLDHDITESTSFGGCLTDAMPSSVSRCRTLGNAYSYFRRIMMPSSLGTQSHLQYNASTGMKHPFPSRSREPNIGGKIHILSHHFCPCSLLMFSVQGIMDIQ
ncbi:hypothetical protein CPB85DRAFT_1280624 [Mucidula mucida]|nr:hypothetical protein CPB85DRAFT_1280624 [Mucidula mucida]